MKTILFAGGGSMGHVAVHLSVYPLLKGDFDNFAYIGSKGGVERAKVENLFDYHEIEAVKLDRGNLFKNIDLPFRLIKAINEAKEILKKVSPSLVFCGGGFVCVPVSIAADKLKIPVVLHESDLSVGLANKISLKFSEKLITTFPDTQKKNRKTICCGPPIRRELFKKDKRLSLQKLGLTGKKPVLLVIGGSKGSAAINSCVTKNLESLLNRYEVLHICGDGHLTNIAKNGYRQFQYLSDMGSVYAAADFALSRCGSNTAFELVAMNIPTLFVPLSKKASRGDQIENAAFFEKNHLAMVLSEENLNGKTLMDNLSDLEKEAPRLKANMKKYPTKNADKKIADVLRFYL